MKPIDFVFYESAGIKIRKILLIGFFYPAALHQLRHVVSMELKNWELGECSEPPNLAFLDGELARN